jgi:C4-dicarboxylate-binding protein DctP
MRDATKYSNAIAQQENDQALELIRKSGKTAIHVLTDKEKAEWRKVLVPVQKDMEGRIGKELIAAVNKESATLGYK